MYIAWVHAPCVCLMLKDSEEGRASSATGVTDLWCRELNLGPLKRQQVHLTG